METRILGISASRKSADTVPLIGLVYRGNAWLDAVILHIMTKSDKSYLLDFAAKLRNSKQYSQIQTAIFSRENILPNGLDDFRNFSDLIEFPILVICKRFNKSSNTAHVEWTPKDNTSSTIVWTSDGRTETAKEIYRLGCKRGCYVPEAVRVADIIAAQL